MNLYLDYQATTPPDPRVIAAMQPYMDTLWGNPHSAHRHGWEAAAGVDVARKHVAKLVGVEPDWVIFTSGATEANNLALKGVMQSQARARERCRIVTLATEHSCVLESARFLEKSGYDLSILDVKADGLVDLEQLDKALGDDVALISVMAVNNEIGVIQPVAEIGALARAKGILFHCDAAQGFGKIPLDMTAMQIDLMSVSAHKIYGPKGVGALLRRPDIMLEPQMHGGGQEGDGLRSGTLAPALIAGLGKAAELAEATMEADRDHAEKLWNAMLLALDGPYTINGSMIDRWRGNLNIGFPGIDGARLIADLRRLSISSGAACSSASGKHSHVLDALGLDRAEAKSSLRIGWGRFVNEKDVEDAAAMINTAVAEQKRYAA